METEDSKNKKGLWSEEEDRVLLDHIKVHGIGQWNRIPNLTGLKRCGKSCRLRWLNYLSPNVKRGCFSEEEDDLIIRLHKLLGNRWSLIAGRVPGRTDNQVKNHWNTHLSKKLGVKKQSKISKKIIPTKNIISPNYFHNNNVAREKEKVQFQDNIDVVQGESESYLKKKAESPAIIFDDDDLFNNHDDGFIDVEFLGGYCFDLVDDQMYWQCF